MKIQCTLCVIVLLSFVGCASFPKGEIFSSHAINASSSKATVVVFRPGRFPASAVALPFLVNDEVKSVLANKTYSVVQINEGVYSLGIKLKDYTGYRTESIEHELEKGRTYYFGIYYSGFPAEKAGERLVNIIRFQPHYGAMNSSILVDKNGGLGIVAEEFALEEVQSLRLSLIDVNEFVKERQ